MKEDRQGSGGSQEPEGHSSHEEKGVLKGNTLQNLSFTVCGLICHKVSLSSNQEDLIQGNTQGLGGRKTVPDPSLFTRDPIPGSGRLACLDFELLSLLPSLSHQTV